MFDTITSKIYTLSQAVEKMKTWQTEHNKVVFTNGCFDILHQGHVTYLAKARDLGTKLIVGLNTDSSVKRLEKGENRPVNSEHARAIVLASLQCVDAVVIFDEDTPFQIIEALQPNVVVKGGDYDPNETDEKNKAFFVGAKETKARGGEALIVALVDGFSTTGIIEKMKK